MSAMKPVAPWIEPEPAMVVLHASLNESDFSPARCSSPAGRGLPWLRRWTSRWS
ncbi:hypothetical protein [Microbacterium sp. YY-01]|uniref:hypothetical protein n=1 Tax=Microbacterium sp. YY-01 TaxID=3421634 RepID=UPI003D17DAB3